MDKYINNLILQEQDMLNVYTEFVVSKHYEHEYLEAESTIDLEEPSSDELNVLISHAQKCKNSYVKIIDFNNKSTEFKVTSVEYWGEKIAYLKYIEKKIKQ